jgi:hypothetical protein
LCIDGKFELAKYSTRWLNRKSFNETAPSINLQLLPAHHHQTPTLGDDDPSFHHDFGEENNESGGQESDEDVALSSLGASKPYKLSFQVGRHPTWFVLHNLIQQHLALSATCWIC